MAVTIEKILEDYGPLLSSDLKDILVEKHSLTASAARQKISRAGNDVYKLRTLPFPRNATFVYLKSQYNSPNYWEALHDALLKTKSAYGLAISSLNARGGLMPFEHFKIACGAPLRQQKHLSPEQIKKRLIDSKILRSTIFNDREIIYLVRIESTLNSSLSVLQGRMSAERILLNGLYNWCRNLGLSSYKQLKIRGEGELPVISTTAWDMAGPSYLSGLTTFNKNDSKVKPGFVSFDVLLNEIVDEEHIRPFLKKVDALKQLRNVGPTIHFFVALQYTSIAFQRLKESGISPATVNNIFGKDVAEGLTSLIDTMMHAASATNTPERLDELFEKLSKLEGASSMVRGALFEFLVAEIIRAVTHPSFIELNKVIRTIDSKQAEIDVFAPQQTGNALVFAECKGLNPVTTLPDAEVDKWLDTRISTIRQYCLEHPEWKNKQLTFQLWTTSNISPASMAKIDKAIETRKKYTLEVFRAEDINKMLYENKLKKLLETFKVHFMGLPRMS